jgi:Protein of unknown function (DUF3499)
MVTGPTRARGFVEPTDRYCTRNGCNVPATATLRFMSIEREAWLVDLDDSGAPTGRDLCAPHATLLALPRGWELRDRRGADPADVPLPRRAALRARRRELVAVPSPDKEGADDRLEDQSVAGEPLSEVLDAQTPLLRRAFRSVWPFVDNDEE